MKHKLLTILVALCALAGTATTAQAETITKTYRFSGSLSNPLNGTYQGYFYEEGKSGAHYTCFPNPWTEVGTSSISATLADGITINIASSINEIYVQNIDRNLTLAVRGNVTVTVGGGTQHNYYIWHVELYNSDNEAAIDEDNWGADVESTHTFSKTIGAGFFYKLVVTYSEQDFYFINESTTTITGVDDEYAYTGSAVEPEPVVVCNGRTLTKGTHYSVNYSDNKAPGTARVLVTGIPPFHGYVTKDYTIFDPASVPLEWAAGSTVEVTEDNAALSPISVTGTGNVTLRIASGATLTAQHGITIADGATLTVEGPGTLKVTYNTPGTEGAAGADYSISAPGSSNYYSGDDGGDGGPGVVAVSGSLIVNGGTVNITGGRGGTGGNGGRGGTGGNGGTGGRGGASIVGALTVNGGTINVTGGRGGPGGDGGSGDHAGEGGYGADGGVGIGGLLTVNGGAVNVTGGTGGLGGNDKYGSSYNYYGSPDKALDGTVTCTAATYLIQESNNNKTWSNLASGSTSGKQYVRVLPLTPLTLYDNADNTAAIAEAAADGKPCTVTLSGRTLYRDGDWNTLCLPFAMTAEQMTAQLAPAKLMTLSISDFAGGELTLTFEDATAIAAGKPYIIKWNKPEGYVPYADPATEADAYNAWLAADPALRDIHDPAFTGVTVPSGYTSAETITAALATASCKTDDVDFIGNFSPETLLANDNTVLYLGAANTLYWPSVDRTIGAFRAWFQLKNGLTAGGQGANVRAFSLNFGDSDETTGIVSTTNLTNFTNSAGAWYDLQGRKLSKKPTQKGIYIKNGKKIIIK